MSETDSKGGIFRVAGLSTRHPTAFVLEPTEADRDAIAGELGLSKLRKLRFEGQIAPVGKRGWQLTGKLGATVVQPCVVTLAPVTTRIDEEITRRYDPNTTDYDAGSEVEMPEDDSVEVLGETISARDVMIEGLSLALPAYPRADGAELGEAVYADQGIAPMTDEQTKPFAGLAALRDSLEKPEET